MGVGEGPRQGLFGERVDHCGINLILLPELVQFGPLLDLARPEQHGVVGGPVLAPVAEHDVADGAHVDAHADVGDRRGGRHRPEAGIQFVQLEFPARRT